MRNQADFSTLVEQAMRVAGRQHMRPVIEKELLHYDILFALEQAGLLQGLAFQGGTALRICHGAPRYSEDLDFAGGTAFGSQELLAIKSCIEHYIGQRYGLDVQVREPDALRSEPEYEGIRVDKWQVSVITAPERRDVPRQRIKIEVASVPAYTREPRALINHYDFLPDGYGDLLILVETLPEIMADKLVSLVNCTRYVRYRDIWDLRWLVQQGAVLDMALLQRKLRDYRADGYLANLDAFIGQVRPVIHGKAFADTLGRFIPADVQARTLGQTRFLDFLAGETVGLLQQVQRALRGEAAAQDFLI